MSDPTTPAAGEGEADDDTGRAVDDETGVIRRGAEAAEDEPSEGEPVEAADTDPTTDDAANGEPGTGDGANGDDDEDEDEDEDA